MLLGLVLLLLVVGVLVEVLVAVPPEGAAISPGGFVLLAVGGVGLLVVLARRRSR